MRILCLTSSEGVRGVIECVHAQYICAPCTHTHNKKMELQTLREAVKKKGKNNFYFLHLLLAHHSTLIRSFFPPPPLLCVHKRILYFIIYHTLLETCTYSLNSTLPIGMFCVGTDNRSVKSSSGRPFK